MKINTRSWHYKAAYFSFDEMPSNNLCAYFWRVVIGVLEFVMLCVLGVLFMGLFLYLLLIPLLIWFFYVPSSFGVFSSVLWTIIGVVTIKEMRASYVTLPYGLSSEVYSCDESSFCRLAVEWLLAKKRKICPTLDFVD